MVTSQYRAILRPLPFWSFLCEGLGAGRRLSVSVDDGGPSPEQASGHQLPDHVAADLRDVPLGESDVTSPCNVFGELAREYSAVDTVGLLGKVPDDLRVEDPGVVLAVEPHGCVVHVRLDVAQDVVGSPFGKETVQVEQLAGFDAGVHQHPMALCPDREENVVEQEHIA